jgi:hypothetical protein
VEIWPLNLIHNCPNQHIVPYLSLDTSLELYTTSSWNWSFYGLHSITWYSFLWILSLLLSAHHRIYQLLGDLSQGTLLICNLFLMILLFGWTGPTRANDVYRVSVCVSASLHLCVLFDVFIVVRVNSWRPSHLLEVGPQHHALTFHIATRMFDRSCCIVIVRLAGTMINHRWMLILYLYSHHGLKTY